MKVKELIEELKKVDGDLPVVVSNHYAEWMPDVDVSVKKAKWTKQFYYDGYAREEEKDSEVFLIR